LSQLQKKGEQGKLEQSTASVISAIENKYKSQIADMNENFNRQINELTDKLRNTEGEYRLAREELELERRGRNKESGSVEKLLADSKNTEEQLRRDMEDLRTSKSNKAAEMAKQYESEKQSVKVKNTELDKRIKEMEH
jgi:phage host-nuclease inhibitor protein Gam